MELIGILTLVLAAYAAILSSVLAVREFQRDRRRVNIMLELLPFHYRAQVTIVNVGHRPVTLADMTFGGAPRNVLFPVDFEEPFPVTLDDGEHITLPLSKALTDTAFSNATNVKLTVYDAEGHEYTKHSAWEHNEKWGRYHKIES